MLMWTIQTPEGKLEEGGWPPWQQHYFGSVTSGGVAGSLASIVSRMSITYQWGRGRKSGLHYVCQCYQWGCDVVVVVV